MLWALVVSLVLNGALVGFIVGVAYSQQGGEEYAAGDVPGGGYHREEEQEYVFDPTVIGFKGAKNG